MAQPPTSFISIVPNAKYHFAVTPSDTVNFAHPTSGLYVGVAGNISVVGADDATTVFPSVPVGWHPICCKRVNATGTAQSAGQIVAVWG
jgi:ABC-type uncharacterized transport system permease subunit